jgi:hypothetical protein
MDAQRVLLDPHARVGERDVCQPAMLGLAPVGVVLLLEVATGEGLGQGGGEPPDEPLGVHA